MADYTGVIYQDISVDVSEPNQFAPLLVAQGDAYTRGLTITITQHGEKLNIPNTGVNASLNACNMADNTKKASTMATINSDGTITAIIPSVVMEVAGYVQCDVSIIGSNGSNATVLKSTVFYLNCEASADTDGSSQPPEDDVITAAIASIAGKVDSSVYNQKIGEIENKISAKANANHTHPIDSTFSQTSTNPIQNKVITGKLNEIISNVNTQFTAKADKATKLAGYGITDAYTKSDTDGLLGNKVDSSVYNQKIDEIEDKISAIAPDETIYDNIAYDNPNASANNNHLLVFFGAASGTNISLGLPPLTSADLKTVFHFEISFIQSDMSKVVLQEDESGTIKTYAEYTPTSGETIEFDYTMTSAAVTGFRMRMYERAGAQEVKVKITKYISVEDYAYSKGEVYNKTEIDDTLDGKTNYIDNINVDNCNTLGSIYRVLIHYNSEDVAAIVIPSRSSRVDPNIAQFAFTANGKILCRKTNNGTWSYKDADDKVHKIVFEEIGGISE